MTLPNRRQSLAVIVGTVLATGAGRAMAAADPVWVVLSESGGIYAEAAAALQAEWKQGKPERELVLHQAQDIPGGAPPAALVTLGSPALRAIQDRLDASPSWNQVPVVAALVPKEGVTALWRRASSQLTVAYLDQPFDRYLDLIKLAWPSFTRVGLLVGPDNAQNSPAMFKAALDRGIKLSVGRVARPDSMFATLRTVLGESDVLLVMPDAAVADAAGLQTMLITAYRQRLPVVAYSPSLVKAGAALGLYASPPQVGHQVAGLLRTTLNGTRLTPRLADGITVAVNEQVCRSLGWSLPEGAHLAEALRR